jgi:hypothetical protein
MTTAGTPSVPRRRSHWLDIPLDRKTIAQIGPHLPKGTSETAPMLNAEEFPPSDTEQKTNIRLTESSAWSLEEFESRQAHRDRDNCARRKTDTFLQRPETEICQLDRR